MQKSGGITMKVDSQLLEKIDVLKLSDRASGQRENFFSCKPAVSGDRARLTVESWKETEGEPIIIRRARMMKKFAEKLPIVIFPGQILACNDTLSFRGASVDKASSDKDR